MKRVIIIGGNGSGKTTFSYKLAEKMQLPLVHTDAIYWQDDWKSVSKERFDFNFYKQVLLFNRRNRKKLYTMIGLSANVECIVFKSRRQVRKYLNNLKIGEL